MKKTLCIVGLLFCIITITSTVQASMTQTNGVVTITTAGVQGAQSIVFNPSSQVVMSGNTVSTSFVIASHHTQANLKKAGQQYGMAADSNSVWFKDISTATADVISTATNKNAFTAGTWFTM